MSVAFWMLLWKVLLIVGIGGFALMAVWVTIGGALDIRKLVRSLGDEPGDDGEYSSPAESAEGSQRPPSVP